MKQNDWYREEDEFGDIMQGRTEELYAVPDSIPDSEGLIECPVVPLRDIVVYPHMISPIFVGRESTIEAIEAAQSLNQTVVAVNQSDPEIDDPETNDFLPIGVELAVGRLLDPPGRPAQPGLQGHLGDPWPCGRSGGSDRDKFLIGIRQFVFKEIKFEYTLI